MLKVISLLVRSCTCHDDVLMCLLSLYALHDALTYLGCLHDHVSRMVFALTFSIYLQAFCDNLSLNLILNLNPRNLSALIHWKNISITCSCASVSNKDVLPVWISHKGGFLYIQDVANIIQKPFQSFFKPGTFVLWKS